VARLSGQLRGGSQVRRRGMIAMQVDHGRGGQQGHPAAHDQQAPASTNTTHACPR
jgi:hypothetical protein